jgi:hypothetical protein
MHIPVTKTENEVEILCNKPVHGHQCKGLTGEFLML